MNGSAGTYIHTRTIGGETNRLKAGLAGSTGVRAAMLAKEGFTGTKYDLEEPDFGFYRCYAENWDINEVTKDLGKEFLCTMAGGKFWAGCGGSHQALAIVAKLRDEHDITPDKVESITVAAKERQWMTSVIPYPQDFVSQQWCQPYVLALTLVDKGPLFTYNFINSYTLERVHDPKMKELTERIKLIAVPEMVPRDMLVTIKTKDGKEYKSGPVQMGPMTLDQVKDKFTKQLKYVGFSEDRIAKLIDIIMNAEKLNDVSQLTEQLVL
jgi:2-methylcitrate dehydratase PrpD